MAGTSILVIYVSRWVFLPIWCGLWARCCSPAGLDYRSFADFVGDYLSPQASFYFRLDLLAELGG